MPGEIFVSHSLNRHFAVLLRKELARLLGPRDLVPFVAEGDLGPGVRWRDKIHARLSACIGAVIVLTPRSASRSWVQHESSVLLHRCGLHGCPKILTLKVTGPGEPIEPKDLERFEPGQLTEYQAVDLQVELPPQEMTASVVRRRFLKSAIQLAQKIDEGFAGLEVKAVPASLAVWFGDIQLLLPNQPAFAQRLRNALKELQPEEDVAQLDGIDLLRDAFAYELILARARAALNAFGRLKGAPGLDARALFERIQLTQVSTRTAETVARILQQEVESRRSIILACVVLDTPPEELVDKDFPASLRSIGDCLLRRVYGCDRDVRSIPMTGLTGEGIEEEIASKAVAEVERRTKDPKSLRDSPVTYVFFITCLGGTEADGLSAAESCARKLAVKYPMLPRIGLARRTGPDAPAGSEEADVTRVLLDDTLSLNDERILREHFAQVEEGLPGATAR